MQQTLFYVPMLLFQTPWLWLWAILIIGIAVWQTGRSGISDAALTWGVPLVALFVFPQFVLPQVTDFGIDPSDPSTVVPLGVAVRGYGLMMLLGISAGVLLAIYRGRSENLSADKIISLAINLALFGIVGARLFYVIQYWESFQGLDFPNNIIAMVNMTKGGLVVFGSFIGAIIATLVWSRLNKISPGKLADIIAPSFVFGLSLGRIGCLLNGCCFGGPCDVPEVAIRFPAGSPPYTSQIEDCSILGLTSLETLSSRQAVLNKQWFPQLPEGQELNVWRTVKSVADNSSASLLGIKEGDEIFLQSRSFPDPRIAFDKVLRAGKAGVKLSAPLILNKSDGTKEVVDWNLLPKTSLPIHATQLYSSLNAFLLAIVIWLFYPRRRFEGQAFALMMIFYSVARFLLEQIRQDEGGQFGTHLTISQWVSIGVFTCGALYIVWGYCSGAKRLPVGKLHTETA